MAALSTLLPGAGLIAYWKLGPKVCKRPLGLERLANYYHIDRQNVIAFGDEHNDNEMIEYAGTGVAMRNATDQLKAIADDVTDLNNDQDGMADYLSNT